MMNILLLEQLCDWILPNLVFWQGIRDILMMI